MVIFFRDSNYKKVRRQPLDCAPGICKFFACKKIGVAVGLLFLAAPPFFRWLLLATVFRLVVVVKYLDKKYLDEMAVVPLRVFHFSIRIQMRIWVAAPIRLQTVSA